MPSSLLLIASMLFFSSCALFTNGKKELSDRYLTGLGLSNDVKSEAIKEHLTRELTMGGGNYTISAYPYSEALIEAMVRETSSIRGLSESAQKSLRKELQTNYGPGKSCFQFDIGVRRFLQLAHLKEWQIEVIDGGEMMSKLSWRESDLERPVMVSNFNDFQGPHPLHQLSGVACSEVPLNLKDGFTLYITPSFMNFPFPKSGEIVYSFANYAVSEEGEVIKVKEAEEAKKKSYRGW